MQNLVKAGVYRQECDLIPLRVAKRDHRNVIPVVDRANARQCPAAVPVRRNGVGHDEIDLGPL